MLRLRMPAGRITPVKMNFIAEALKKYDVKTMHFTTCQAGTPFDSWYPENVEAFDAIAERYTK